MTAPEESDCHTRWALRKSISAYTFWWWRIPTVGHDGIAGPDMTPELAAEIALALRICFWGRALGGVVDETGEGGESHDRVALIEARE